TSLKTHLKMRRKTRLRTRPKARLKTCLKTTKTESPQKPQIQRRKKSDDSESYDSPRGDRRTTFRRCSDRHRLRGGSGCRCGIALAHYRESTRSDLRAADCRRYDTRLQWAVPGHRSRHSERSADVACCEAVSDGRQQRLARQIRDRCLRSVR